MVQRILQLAVFVGAVCLSGCGGDWGTATGAVTLDDVPLKNASITFNPTTGAPGYGQVIDGKFSISTGAREGLKPGSYVVTILASTPPDDDRGIKGEFLTPEKYADRNTSDLKAEVAAGPNSFVFKMSSR